MINSVSEKTLAAYKEALANYPVSHFAVSSLASVVIRLSGREGRVAVQAAQREKIAARPILTPSQNITEKKAFRKLEFSKKNDQTEAPKKASNFGLKRVSKTGVVTEMDLTEQEDQTLLQTSGEHQEHTTFLQSNGQSGSAAGKSEDDLTNTPQDIPDGVEYVALTGEALEAVKQMKPAAIGRSFSLGQLQETLLSLGIEYNEAHTPTILGAALLQALKAR